MNEKFDTNFIISSLQEAGWSPVQTDEHWLLIPVQEKQVSFFISFYFDPHNQMLAARGNIPVDVPQDQEIVILKFANYCNYKTSVGNFEFDMETQQLFFRMGMFFQNIVLNSQLVHNVAHEVYQAVRDFQPLVQAVVEDKMSIEDAFTLLNSN